MPIALAFVAGGLATVNPCGFALLPALLSFYVGADERDLPSRSTRLAQSLVVGATVTAGFLLVFAVVGIPITLGATAVITGVPWAGVAVGVAMILVGVFILGGKHLSFAVRSPLQVRRGEKSPKAMFLFGIAYAVASLGCTLPVFLAVVGASLATRGAGPALVVFGSYGIGMAVVLMALAVGAGLLRDGIARGLKGLVPHMNRIAGGLLLVAGIYLTYYWSRVLWGSAATLGDDPIVGFVSRFTATVERSASGDGRWFILAAAVIVIGAVMRLTWRGGEEGS